MVILGIDPGIGRCGWGIVNSQLSVVSCQSYGCIETSSKLPVEKRLGQIHREVEKIIKKYSPDVLSIEELFWGTNSKTAFVVGEARGVILLCASQNNLPIFIYTPLQVKIAVTGYGRAEKGQIGKMVKALLKLDTVPKPDDTSDALAVALAHAFSAKSLH
ncbi:MAG: crossover junction endodeoxyribonuclease RuvC [Candidatus Levybacteria bacterium]|nr:crossover junction endodeoxyribonuclease RuvC [Candidatus Levybacteria bacterium]